MDINIFRTAKKEKEHLDIYCHETNGKVKEIVDFVKSRQGRLSGTIDNVQYEIPISDIFYIESVDNKAFIYSREQVYEIRDKLYKLEEMLYEKRFLRVSKSVILNLMKVDAIKPSMNSRFIAVLQSGEKIIISRKYVPALKKALKGEDKL